MEAFHNFTIPFLKESKDELLCLSSGKPASNKIKDDLLKWDDYGSTAMTEFINEVLLEKSIPFQEPIKQIKFKTFASVGLIKKAVIR